MLIALASGYEQPIPDLIPDASFINITINKPFQISDLEAALLMLYTAGEKRRLQK
jgi:hypothetical protein